MITITEAAAKEIQRQLDKRGTPDALIRIGVRGGGCNGFSYSFEFEENAPNTEDHVFDRLVIDPKSFIYLDGSELDFVNTLMGHGFKLNNPQQKGSCSCGASVQF